MTSPDKSSAPSKAKKLPLSLILALTPSNIDAFLSHLNRCLETPSGIDTVLLFVGYASRLAASLIDSATDGTVEQHARRFLSLVPLESAKALAAVAVVPSKNATALRAAASLRAIYSLLTDVRTFMRLWGLLGMYMALKQLIRKEIAIRRGDKTAGAAGKEERIDRVIAWTKLIGGIAFQVLENGAFLAQKNIIDWTPATQFKAMQWSVRFWAVTVGVELGRLAIEKVRKETGDITTAEHQEWRANWNRSVARNLAWAPLTVHWSMDKGFVNDTMIGVLATIPGLIQIRQLWKATA